MDTPAYKIRRSKRAKHIRLTIRNPSEVILTLPKFVPEFLGHQFVKAKRDWILSTIRNISTNALPTKIYQDGNKIKFLGTEIITLKIESSLSKSFVYDVDQLKLKITKPEDIKDLLEKFYKTQARDYITHKALHYSERLGVQFNRIALKNNRTNWGSCSSKKNLNFNWRIILAPKEIVDYLVIHEVCHLREMNHGSNFWALVKQLDPNYKTHKAWLKANEKGLVL